MPGTRGLFGVDVLSRLVPTRGGDDMMVGRHPLIFLPPFIDPELRDRHVHASLIHQPVVAQQTWMMLAAGFRPYLNAIGMCQFRPAAVMAVGDTIGDRPPQ